MQVLKESFDFLHELRGQKNKIVFITFNEKKSVSFPGKSAENEAGVVVSSDNLKFNSRIRFIHSRMLFELSNDETQ